MKNIRSIAKLMISHTIPIITPSLINSRFTFLKYLIEKNTTVKVKTTGIIDSNKGLLVALNGKNKKRNDERN